MIIRKIYEEINKNIEEYLSSKNTNNSKYICDDVLLHDSVIYVVIKEYSYLTKEELINNKPCSCAIYSIEYSEILKHIKKER